MSNLLLEIGCEEIPARFMPGFLADLKKKAEEKLTRERLSFAKIETLGTARRLVLFIENISPRQTDLSQEIKGPSAEAAFDQSGKPTQAAIGFASAQHVDVRQLVVKPVNNRNYVFANVTRQGLPTEKVLVTLLPEIIASLYQPLAMRWGSLDFKFTRPIHSLLALYGSKVIRFELAGIKSSNQTFGHRYHKLKPQTSKVKTAEFSLYKRQLLKLGVMVDQEERKTLIKQQVETAAKKAGGTALIKPELLDEVTFLVESPLAYVGKFDPGFLVVPQEVLITSMQKNQKYFPLLDKAGRLQAKFIVVTDGCKNKKAVAGNEKVLSARLSDARFFFEEDLKQPLKLLLPELTKVAFMEKLGNLAQKTERIAHLGLWLGKRLGLSDTELQTVKRVAELSKADLVTKMVYEFPDLQGVMGGEYAARSGEPPQVAQGIVEHYLPRHAEDQLPLSLPGTIVALADRFDTLVGAFAAGYIPTGSEDPYGLRRAAQGIIRIILDKKLDLLLDETLEHSYDQYESIFGHNRPDFAKIKKELLDFLSGRLRPLLLDQGIRYDIADAVLVGYNDILDVVEKARALHSLVKEPWFAGVVASADRLLRIAGNTPPDQVREHDLEEATEKELYSLYLKVNWAIREHIKREDWAAACQELVALTDPIERFFDQVLVMHEDERLKRNRLALLKSLVNLYLALADFSKIVI